MRAATNDPDPHQALTGTPVGDASDRHPVELLADRFIAELRDGSSRPIDGWAADTPTHESSIRDLFPTIRALERMRHQCGATARGRASLGPAPPERLGDYRILREIGRGGMGVVFEAEQETLRRIVAIKVLPRVLLADSSHVERFQREAQTAARLHHTNIVPVFGVGEQDGFHFYVMQRIDGIGLDRFLRGVQSSGTTWPVPGGSRSHWCARAGVQAAAALQYAHEQGVLHRDIKPANLLTDSQGLIWVTDFGLATVLQPESAAADLVGTLRYMSPEQLQGKCDPRSDIYSLGVTLYELLVGLPPVANSSEVSPVLPPLRQRDRSIPRDLAAIVQKAVAPDADDRYQSAGELGDDLRRFLAGFPVRARPTFFLERAWRWSRRSPGTAALGLVSVLLLAAVAALAAVDYFRIEHALAGESVARTSAERNARLAANALDQIFARFAVGKPGQLAEDGEWSTVTEQPVLSQEVASLLHELVEYYDQLAAENATNPVTLRRAADARRTVAEIRLQLGQYEEAVADYEDSARLYERLNVSAPANPIVEEQRILSLARIRNGIGQAQLFLENPVESQRAFRQSLQILAGGSAAVAALPSMRHEVARTYFLMSRRIRPGLGPRALPPYEGLRRGLPPRDQTARSGVELGTAIELLTTLSREEPQRPQHQLLLAACFREQAGDSLADRTAADHRADQEAIRILEELLQRFPDHAGFRFELAQTLSEFTVWGTSLRGESLNEAESRLLRALTHFESLVAEHPQVPEYATSLVHCHGKLAAIRERRADAVEGSDRELLLDEAARHLRRASQGLAALIRRFPAAIGYAAWQALFQEQLGNVHRAQGRYDESYTVLTRAVRNLDELVAQHADERGLPQQLGRAYASLAMTCEAKGDSDGAAAAREAADRLRGSVDGSGRPPRPPPPPRRRPGPPPRKS